MKFHADPLLSPPLASSGKFIPKLAPYSTSMRILKRAIERVSIPYLWNHFSLPGDVEPSCCVSSPFREDNHPSFSIYADGRRFKDHGTGEGGDSFDFYCLATGLSKREAFRSFLTIAGLNPWEEH